MIALLLIYFVGKAFYELAGQHNKSQWGFAVLGVVSYYIGTIIGGVIIVLIYELALLKSIDDVGDMVLGVLSIPFGVLVCWLFYRILNNVWSKQSSATHAHEDVLDADLLNNTGTGTSNNDNKSFDTNG